MKTHDEYKAEALAQRARSYRSYRWLLRVRIKVGRQTPAIAAASIRERFEAIIANRSDLTDAAREWMTRTLHLALSHELDNSPTDIDGRPFDETGAEWSAHMDRISQRGDGLDGDRL